MSDRSRLILALLLAVFLARAFLYGSLVPLNGMPDELEHMAQIRVAQYWPQIEAGETDLAKVADNLVAEFTAIDSCFPQPREPFGVMAHQPLQPRRTSLYYRALGGLLRLLDVDNGLKAWHLCRWISVLMGLCLVCLAWRTAATIFPGDRLTPVLCAGFIALLPQLAAVTASVNPDNLAMLAGAGFFYLASLAVRRGLGWTALVGAIIILALLPWLKKTTYFIFPLTLLYGLWILKRRLAGRPYAWAVWTGVCLVLAAAVYLALFYPPWANRLAALLGVPLYMTYEPGFDHALFRQQGVWEIIRDFLDFRDIRLWLHLKTMTLFFFKSFWAYFGYFEVPISWGWYIGALALLLAGLVGWLKQGLEGLVTFQRRCLISFFIGLVLAIIIIFARTTLVVQWQTSLAQGRHLFPALIPLAVLWAWGFRSLPPARLQNYAGAIGLGFLWLMDLWSLWAVAVPWFHRLYL